MSDVPLPQSEIILYQTEDGRTRVQCRFENETLWLTQAQMAELFQIGVNTVNYHLKAIFVEGELRPEATIRCYRIVQTEGAWQVTREIEHYNLDAILAVGFRVRSHRGTQFRHWATARLSEYLVKGFTMDDERLKNPPGKGQKDYFNQRVFAGLRGAEVEDAGERTGSEAALLSKRLAPAVPKLNPALPSDAVEQVVRSIWPLNPAFAQEGVPL